MINPEVRVNNDVFRRFYEQTNILFPKEIQKYAIANPKDEIDLNRMILEITEGKRSLDLIVQISERLAEKIIEGYYALGPDEHGIQMERIKSMSPDSADFSEGLLTYLLLEGVDLYDYHSNTFKIELINEAYRKLNANIEEIKVVLCTWAHCGGWGGIIINGKNKWFRGGGMHGHYLEVDVQGKKYEYNSNYYERMEKRFTEGSR